MALKYLPDLRYLPEGLPRVDANTSLNSGIALGNFLKGVTLDHIPEVKDRIQIARNLLPQAQILKAIGEDSKRFSRHKLVVIEGLYKADPQEQITELEENTNFLATTGRSVVYELKRNNSIDNEKTFELARFLQTYHRTYDKLILDYDTYNPDGSLNAQIIVTTPNIPSGYQTVDFKRQYESRFNNNVMGKDFIEVTSTPRTSPPTPSQESTQSGYYTVGDIHSKLIAVHGGSPWETFAESGRTARNTIVIDNINKLKNQILYNNN